MDFDVLVKAIVEHPAAAIAAAEALAIVALFRDLRKANQSKVDIAIQVTPVAARVAEAVTVMERLYDRLERRYHGE